MVLISNSAHIPPNPKMRDKKIAYFDRFQSKYAISWSECRDSNSRPLEPHLFLSRNRTSLTVALQPIEYTIFPVKSRDFSTFVLNHSS